jgi:PhoH-like ATPase
LHDPNSIYRFAEHDVYIPLAVVDDLDEQKTRKENVGFSAREVFRFLDQFDIKELTEGAKLNDKGGKIFIYNPEVPNVKTDTPNITRINSDNAIINACLNLKSRYPKRKVIIVSKDTGLRIRAIAWGCLAENYRSDLIDDEYYDGVRYIEITNQDDYNALWSNVEIQIDNLSKEMIGSLSNLYPNEYVIFTWGDMKIPTRYKAGKLVNLKDKSNNQNNGKPKFMGIQAKNIEQTCAIDALSDDDISLVTMCGSAGTGKTLLSLAVALKKINDGVYDRLIIMKPIVPVGGKDLGALPGDKTEKLYHWLGPIRDNIEQLIGSKGGNSKSSMLFEDLIENGIIEVEAMTYIQGRSIPNSIILLDEAENISPREARMVVERCGKDSKVIFLGDLSQVENPYLDARSCGLAHAMNAHSSAKQKGETLENVACVSLKKVERSKLAEISSVIFNSPEAQR